MGYCVIGYGSIESTEFTDKELEKIKGFLEEENKKFPSTFRNIEVETGTVFFEMDGNKGIDYEPLERVKKKVLNLGSHPFQIYVSEYMECEDGYYFETEN